MVDQSEETTAVSPGAFEVGAGSRIEVVSSREQVVDGAEGERERRPEFMGDIDQEPRLEFIGLPQLGRAFGHDLLQFRLPRLQPAHSVRVGPINRRDEQQTHQQHKPHRLPEISHPF